MRPVQLTIPEPCSESWNSMAPAGDGRRHCAACDRVLTDFSAMSDDELMLYFSQNKGKLCGRFSPGQLDRTLQPIAQEHRTQLWWKAAALLPLALFAGKASAQQSTAAPVAKVPRTQLTLKGDTLPKTTAAAPDTLYTITGTVTDAATGETLPFVNVWAAPLLSFDGARFPATTDIDGNYTLTIPAHVALEGLYVEASDITHMSARVEFQNGLPSKNTRNDMRMETEIVNIVGELIVSDPGPESSRTRSFWKKIRGTFSFK